MTAEQQPSPGWQVATFMVVLVAACGFASHLPVLLSWLRWLQQSFQRSKTTRRTGSNTSFEEQVRANVQARRHRLLAFGLRIGCNMCFVGMLLAFFARFRLIATPSPENAKTLMTSTPIPMASIAFMPLKFFSNALSMQKGHLTRKVMNALYVVLSVLSLFRVWKAETLLELANVHHLRICCLCFMALIFADSRATLPINIISALAYAAKYWSLPGNGSLSARDEAIWVVSTGLWTIFATTATSAFMEMEIEREVRASLAAQNDGAAFQSMLSCMCDSVVNLDKNLHIEASSPKLAHMISSLADLSGRSFADLLSSETERVRFQSYIDKSCEMYWERSAAAAPTAAHSASLAAGDCVVQVRFFHSCRLKPDGELSHLLGVCHGLSDEASSEGSANLARFVPERQSYDKAAAFDFFRSRLGRLGGKPCRSVGKGSSTGGSTSVSSGATSSHNYKKLRQRTLCAGMAPSMDSTACEDAWAEILS